VWIIVISVIVSLIVSILATAFMITRYKPSVLVVCVCGHGSNVHSRGTGACQVSYGISDKHPKGASCACDVLAVNALPPKDKSAGELERMVGL